MAKHSDRIYESQDENTLPHILHVLSEVGIPKSNLGMSWMGSDRGALEAEYASQFRDTTKTTTATTNLHEKLQRLNLESVTVHPFAWEG